MNGGATGWWPEPSARSACSGLNRHPATVAVRSLKIGTVLLQRRAWSRRPLISHRPTSLPPTRPTLTRIEGR